MPRHYDLPDTAPDRSLTVYRFAYSVAVLIVAIVLTWPFILAVLQ